MKSSSCWLNFINHNTLRRFQLLKGKSFAFCLSQLFFHLAPLQFSVSLYVRYIIQVLRLYIVNFPPPMFSYKNLSYLSSSHANLRCRASIYNVSSSLPLYERQHTQVNALAFNSTINTEAGKRNIALRVNKYFSNKSTRCENVVSSFSLSLSLPPSFPLFSFSVFYSTNVAHTASPICATVKPSIQQISR